MGCPPSAARAHHGEVCAVDDFQLVAVRVAHRADADHTSQLGGEGGGGAREEDRVMDPRSAHLPCQQMQSWSH